MMTDIQNNPPTQGRSARRVPAWALVVALLLAVGLGVGGVWYWFLGKRGGDAKADRGQPAISLVNNQMYFDWGHGQLVVTPQQQRRGGALAGNNAFNGFAYVPVTAADSENMALRDAFLNYARYPVYYQDKLALSAAQAQKLRGVLPYRPVLEPRDRNRLEMLFASYMSAKDSAAQDKARQDLFDAVRELGDRYSELLAARAEQIRGALSAEQLKQFRQVTDAPPPAAAPPADAAVPQITYDTAGLSVWSGNGVVAVNGNGRVQKFSYRPVTPADEESRAINDALADPLRYRFRMDKLQATLSLSADQVKKLGALGELTEELKAAELTRLQKAYAAYASADPAARAAELDALAAVVKDVAERNRQYLASRADQARSALTAAQLSSLIAMAPKPGLTALSMPAPATAPATRPRPPVTTQARPASRPAPTPAATQARRPAPRPATTAIVAPATTAAVQP